MALVFPGQRPWSGYTTRGGLHSPKLSYISTALVQSAFSLSGYSCKPLQPFRLRFKLQLFAGFPRRPEHPSPSSSLRGIWFQVLPIPHLYSPQGCFTCSAPVLTFPCVPLFVYSTRVSSQGPGSAPLPVPLQPMTPFNCLPRYDLLKRPSGRAMPSHTSMGTGFRAREPAAHSKCRRTQHPQGTWRGG